MTFACHNNSGKHFVAASGAEVFQRTVKFLLTGSCEADPDSKDNQASLGILPHAEDSQTFCKHWLELLEKGCTRFIVFCLPTCRRMPTEIATHSFLAPLCGDLQFVDSLESLANEINRAGNGTFAATIPSIRLYLEAICLQNVLKAYSHGQTTDVVNGFLAPARMLLQAGSSPSPSHKQEWKALWDHFQRGALENVESTTRSLDAELKLASDPITRWLSCEDAGACEPDLERFMLLLTRVRVLSQSEAKNTTKPPKSSTVHLIKNSPKIDYRLLVADDHAASWRPVFEAVGNVFRQGGVNLTVDFSLDGKKTADTSAGTPVAYGSYDLILLDVFLGNRDGADILEILRRDFSQLPVLLWTTSRSDEIAARSRLANGVLLKKTIRWTEFLETIKQWLFRGKAIRTASLPSPFFNHTICKLQHRELAIAFHEWCLKQLDSFHALDDEFFRYFTDHGGRHIVKLWELMEHAIRGFLGDEKDNLLLPVDRDEREVEILGLYLAVICHELGMFPMRVGGTNGQVEDFSTLGKGYLNDVRTLHAARGMVLLQEDTPTGDGVGVYWNDNRGQELAKMLREGSEGLAMRVAVLVGYHARLFKSLKKRDFLVWKSASADLKTKMGNLNSAVVVLCRSDSAFRHAFRNLARSFSHVDAKERLRRQCALFRFVDALDATASRNPADFLVGQNKLPPKQYGENLKRELCAEAGIRNGDVYAVMRVGFPQLQTLRSIFAYVEDGKLMKEKEQPLAARAVALIKSGDAARITETPWKPEADPPWTEDSIENRSAASLQKPLDRWLEEVWKVLVLGTGSSGFAQHLKVLGILDEKSLEPKLLLYGAETIAACTALSVAGELLDEYRGILETELHDKIRLPRDGDSSAGNQTGFVWENNPWKSLPSGLVTLEKVFPAE